MIYAPKRRKFGIRLPYGYYVSPKDPNVLIPDAALLDALHYAFRMRAKYHTPWRDCAMWLHMTTSVKMTHVGFRAAYKRWAAKVRKEHIRQINAQRRQDEAKFNTYIQENFQPDHIVLDDRPDISALAKIPAKAKD
jgi:hypothetical protein